MSGLSAAGSTLSQQPGPGTDHAVRCGLPKGLRLEITGQSGDWLATVTALGQAGFVHRDHATPDPVRAAPRPAPSTLAPASPVAVSPSAPAPKLERKVAVSLHLAVTPDLSLRV
ncbi:hypothetical protein [Thetidibacter halocola]|uniref:hypothetical protein n=1 Tax=Thetidibacter halocola TaxID=2827239 RepID=UPI001BAB06A9|nr:hypothetical protein [Thetidibacter halocola]